MCAVSMVGDHYSDKWKVITDLFPTPAVSRAEFDELKRDVEECKMLLKRAAEYDRKNNEPECQNDEKLAILRKVAEMVGVNLDEAFE